MQRALIALAIGVLGFAVSLWNFITRADTGFASIATSIIVVLAVFLMRQDSVRRRAITQHMQQIGRG